MEKAAEGFESFYILTMLKELDKTAHFTEKGYTEETEMAIFYEKVADYLSKRGIGIKEVIMKYLSRKGLKFSAQRRTQVSRRWYAMKIENDTAGSPAEQSLRRRPPSKGGAMPVAPRQKLADPGDKVELSGLEKAEGNRLKEQVQALPAVDEDKVASVKQAIDSGTYNAKGIVVARSILKSSSSTRRCDMEL